MSTSATELAWAVIADTRLRREYEHRKRALIRLAVGRYRLSAEDAEEAADDTLLQWYRKLCCTGALTNDRRFCERVLWFEAFARIRRRRPGTVELSIVQDELGADPRLDSLIADSDATRRLCTVAARVLTERELQAVWLLAHGHSHRQAGQRLGCSECAVRHSIERARRKLRAARELDPSLTA